MKRASLLTVVILATAFSAARAQEFGKVPNFVSPEVAADRKVTFRVFAPKAGAVRLTSSDIPGLGKGEMKKSEAGVWETTVGPVPAGSHRYSFDVDGLAVIDPRNPATSEANTRTFSLVTVPGSEMFDLKNVPHGAVAQVTYESKSLKRLRRMHVYTPPGYEKGDAKYPVFYLLHGASDSDASWSTVGRAGVILDNLIAADKAKPMIVVMPAGHTGPFRFGPGENTFEKQMSEFTEDFVNDLKPYVEKTYRVLDGKANRAIAGLSMGGAQSLNVAIPHLEDYAYIGVYSSGVFGIAGGFGGGAPNTKWQETHQKALDSAEGKKGLRLFWFATGKDDFLLKTTHATVEMLKKHGFDITYVETPGGHTWLNWRDYLVEFAPRLFAKE